MLINLFFSNKTGRIENLNDLKSEEIKPLNQNQIDDLQAKQESPDNNIINIIEFGDQQLENKEVIEQHLSEGEEEFVSQNPFKDRKNIQSEM